MQPLRQDEVHDAAIVLPELTCVSQVPPELRRNPPEGVEPVVPNDLLDFFPCRDMILRVGRADDANVLETQIAQEVWTYFCPLILRDVDLPVR